MAMARRCLSLGLAYAPRQVALLDVLDHVPADVEVMGHVEDGHAPRQLQDVTLEGLGVAAPRIGEGDLDLADQPAGLTFDPRDGQDHGRLAAADGQGEESPLGVTAGDDLAGAAGRAATVVGILWMVKIIAPP